MKVNKSRLKKIAILRIWIILITKWSILHRSRPCRFCESWEVATGRAETTSLLQRGTRCDCKRFLIYRNSMKFLQPRNRKLSFSTR